MPVRRLALCAVLALALAPSAARAAAPFGFVGMNAEDVYGGDDAYQERMFALMQSKHVTLVRQNFRWGYSEPARGVYDWSNVDRFVLAAARHGIRVLPLVYGETTWGTSRPPGHAADNCTYPPKHFGDFAAWAGALAARYGRNGTLWRENPRLAHQAMTAYEIWNEPNEKRFWACKPDAYAYVSLARSTAGAIHEVDPDAGIISAGAPKATKNRDYFNAMFKAGARKVFDALGMHPYEDGSEDVMDDLHEARKRLDDKDATSWSLVVTEFGWATGGPEAEGRTTTEGGQRDRLENVIGKMAKERKKLKLKSAAYYAWHDVPPAPRGEDYWGLHTGLLRLDDSAKPALDALARAAEAAD